MKFGAYLALVGAASAHAGHFMHKIEHMFKDLKHKIHEATADETPVHHEKYGAVQGHFDEFGLKGINIAALLACIGEEDKAALVLDAAVQTFEQAYADHSVEEAVGGAIALYAAYQQAVQGIPACRAIPSSAFEKKLAEPMTETKKMMVAETLQGFLKGSKVGTFDITALLECIYSADQAAEVMYVAISQIEPEAYHDHSIVEALLGVFFMYSAVETFETQALPICEQVDKNSKWNLSGHFTRDGSNIDYNDKVVSAQVETAFSALEKHEYEVFGEKFGQIMAPAETLF